MTDGLGGTDRSAIAKRIAALQKALGFEDSNKLFAQRCGIKEAALSNYLTAYRRPNYDQIALISAGTGAPVDWILYEKQKRLLPHDLYEDMYGTD